MNYELNTALGRFLDNCQVREIGQLKVSDYGHAVHLYCTEQLKYSEGSRWCDLNALTEGQLKGADDLAGELALQQSKGNHSKSAVLLAQLGQILYDAIKGDANVKIAEILDKLNKRNALRDENEACPVMSMDMHAENRARLVDMQG